MTRRTVEQVERELIPLDQLSRYIKKQTDLLVRLRHDAANPEMVLRDRLARSRPARPHREETFSTALLNWSLGPTRLRMRARG